MADCLNGKGDGTGSSPRAVRVQCGRCEWAGGGGAGGLAGSLGSRAGLKFTARAPGVGACLVVLKLRAAETSYVLLKAWPPNMTTMTTTTTNTTTITTIANTTTATTTNTTTPNTTIATTTLLLVYFIM